MSHEVRSGGQEGGSEAARLFDGPGEMRGLCRALDWAATPLGPVDGWPAALRYAARLCLDSGFAMCVFAGPDLILLYNEGYVEALGRGKHPAALGRPAREVWAEVWDQVAPEFAQVLAGGPPVHHEHQRFVIERDGRLEETYWTYAFSPVRDEDGAVVGVHSVVTETTARERADAALRGSEARFRLMADTVPQIVWITDADGRVEFFNQQWSAYTGRPYEPTTAAEVAATAVHPDDGAITLERFDAARRTGGRFEVEHRIRAATGEYRWFLVRAEPYRDRETAEIVRWFGASVDIHDRKLAEAELERLTAQVQAERERLRALVLSVPAPVALHVGPELRFAIINPAFRQISGGGRDDTGLPMREAFPELPGQGIIEALERVYATGEPWSADEVPLRYDRRGQGLEDTWFNVRYEAVRDAAGAVVGVLNFAVDVTDQVLARREVERLLAESERARAAAGLERRRLETVLEQLPVGVHVAEAPSGRLVLDNAAVREICGEAPRSEHVAVYSADYAGHYPAGHPRAGEPLVSDAWPLARALATGATVGEELVEIRRHDGTRRLAAISAAPVRDAEGRVVGAVATSVDVTERERLLAGARAARLAAEEAQVAAEAANRAKSEFLAVMSHELRTPLNAIGGYAELIELGIHGPVTEAQRAALSRIQTSQRHLLGLIAGVLDYSRVEAGAVAYQLTDVPVAEAVSEAESLVAPQLRAKGLGYAWSGAPPGLRVRADREKLQQILLNLLGNAIKFTNARDGAPGRIEVACTADSGEGEAGAGGRVRILVRDSGAGIAAEALERIFEPFVQVDQRLTRPHAGVGLGLAISRDLARGMGGDLTAESEPGVGSTFTLALPAAP